MHTPDLQKSGTFLPDSLETHGTLLTTSIEQRRVRACLLENIGGHYRLAAWHMIQRQLHKDLAGQIATVCRQMGKRLGRRLWDDAANSPLLTSDDPIRYPPLEHFAVTASPLPHLRVWVAGLTPGHSIVAAKSAIASSPAKLVGASFLSTMSTPEQIIHDLEECTPDVLVIVGGYDLQDSRTHQPVHSLCALLKQALRESTVSVRPALFFAGNHWAAPEVEQDLHSLENLQLKIVQNVMPIPGTLRQNALVQALHDHYWHLCRKMDGFTRLEQWVTGPKHITTVESNFSRLVHAWMELQGLPELYGIFCDGHYWLHVYATEQMETVQMTFTEPDERPLGSSAWPPLQIVCGPWPHKSEPPVTVTWWDRTGMAPIVAAIGHVAPAAMVQTLAYDLLAGRTLP